MYSNELKHQRAIKKLKDEARAKGADMATWSPREEDVKAEYLKMGGLWIPQNETVQADGEESEAPRAPRAPRRGRAHKEETEN